MRECGPPDRRCSSKAVCLACPRLLMDHVIKWERPRRPIQWMTPYLQGLGSIYLIPTARLYASGPTLVSDLWLAGWLYESDPTFGFEIGRQWRRIITYCIINGVLCDDYKKQNWRIMSFKRWSDGRQLSGHKKLIIMENAKYNAHFPI